MGQGKLNTLIIFKSMLIYIFIHHNIMIERTEQKVQWCLPKIIKISPYTCRNYSLPNLARFSSDIIVYNALQTSRMHISFTR